MIDIKPINVVSLFDGKSGGQQALERAGIPVKKYFASEIDKYAITVTQKNYPNTIQLGNVINVSADGLPKIDLLIGGSPCQSFSFSGKRKGMSTKNEIEILTLEHYLQLKAEGYEFEGQSYLFWEYMRLLSELRVKNPNIKFLLDNVEMGEKWERVLSKAIGVNGLHINSALVSGQNRERIYWTNIGMVPGGLFGELVSIIQQPKDRGILLNQILEPQVDKKYFLSDVMLKKLQLWTNPIKNIIGHSGTGNQKGVIYSQMGKMGAVCASDYKQAKQIAVPCSDEDLQQIEYKKNTGSFDLVGAIRFGRTAEAKQIRKENLRKGVDHTPFIDKEITGINEDKMNTLTTASNKYNLIIVALRGRLNEHKKYIQEVEPNFKSKTNTLTSAQKDNLLMQIDQPTAINTDFKSKLKIRRLTPTEYERLQTVKDGYTAHVSDTQRYKMLGNGFTVEVIAHIFSYLAKDLVINNQNHLQTATA
jgi:DNA (cytosine-5)-methyltransferase 1